MAGFFVDQGGPEGAVVVFLGQLADHGNVDGRAIAVGWLTTETVGAGAVWVCMGVPLTVTQCCWVRSGFILGALWRVVNGTRGR